MDITCNVSGNDVQAPTSSLAHEALPRGDVRGHTVVGVSFAFVEVQNIDSKRVGMLV